MVNVLNTVDNTVEKYVNVGVNVIMFGMTNGKRAVQLIASHNL